MSAPQLREPVGPGQESVWDYPRPPLVRPTGRPVEIVLGGEVVCRTTSALQVLETSHPPTWYLPRADFVPMDTCLVDGRPVVPQPGGFYGGWITPEVTGPFKGIAGSLGW